MINFILVTLNYIDVSSFSFQTNFLETRNISEQKLIKIRALLWFPELFNNFKVQKIITPLIYIFKNY